MADLPENPFARIDLEESRAALAPTLAATAAILPWVSKPQPVRFPPELNKRWIAACQELADGWAARHSRGATSIRPTIFTLLGVALETGDIDCLRLGEALASAADRLEANPGARLIAALSATSEALLEANGLENSGFVSRAQHFTQRLEQSLLPSNKPGERSDVLDNLFVHDNEERLERMRDALAVLPIDVYALQLETQEMIQQAQEIDLYGMIHLGRQLADYVAQMHETGEEEQERARLEIGALLDTIDSALAAINP
jgi:hypothetical protein